MKENQVLDPSVAYLKVIREVSDSVARAASMEEVFTVALDGLEKGLFANRSAILLLDEDGVARFKAWRGISNAYRNGVEGHFPWRNGDNPKSIFISDVESADGLQLLRNVILQEGIRALAFIPLVFHERILGKFMIYFDRPHDFMEHEILLGETIATLVSCALEGKKKEESLQVSIRDKEVLLREIHHRINNNLQMVSSMLNLQLLSMDHEGLRRMLQESISRVHSMAMVHDELYQSDHGTGVDLQRYLKGVIDHLLTLYATDRDIIMDVDCMNTVVNPDTALRLGLILNEIVSNSLEHAFANRVEGKIFVRMPDKQTLIVGDNGSGLPDGITVEEAPTLGMKIVRLLTRHMNGTIRSLPANGTSYAITFPVIT